MSTLSLDEVLAYARCPLEWFWERRAGLPRLSTPEGLKSAALRQALGFYYDGQTDQWLKAMDWVWRDWCEAWGEPSIFYDLIDYATRRADLLQQIQHDKGRGASYGERMHRAGLVVLGRRLDDFARAGNRVLLSTDAQAIGSALGDAFAECRQSMEQASRFAESMPSRSECLGQDVPYQVELSDQTHLEAHCDLLWRRAGDEPGEVSLEVHDMRPASSVRSRWAKHDLRVIAASLARPLPQANPSWQSVRRVVCRHWPSGTSYVFTETNAGHLQAVVATVLRGLRAQALVPRALADPGYCHSCLYQQPCWEDGGWEKRHLVDPGAYIQGEQIRQMVRELRQAVGEDDVAAQRARAALAAAATTLEQSGLTGTAVEEAMFALSG